MQLEALDTWPDVREIVARRLRPVRTRFSGVAPGRQTLRQDGMAGLIGAVSSVPDGMAAGVLAGVSPVFGLYACFVGPLVGGLFTKTPLLIVATTSAAALAAGQGLGTLEGDERESALFLIVVLSGGLQLAAGLLRLGSLTRFVSHSVMTGFLTGIALLVILGQLGTLTGYNAVGSSAPARALDLLLHIGDVNLLATVIGISALGLAVWLPRTRVGAFGPIVALAVPSAVALALSWTTVETVESQGAIPRGVPIPALPDLSALSLDVMSTALAISVISLVQCAGVSQTVQDPASTGGYLSRNFVAQGLANLASGVFRGIPVGGSAGQTALNASVGARTRWAGIFAGLWMLIILTLLLSVVARVAMPALAALLILAGFNALHFERFSSVWRVGTASRLALAATFASTLFLPIQLAVGLGVLLSAFMHLMRASTDISLVELKRLTDGRLEERAVPRELPANQLTLLVAYGSLFYAGAWTLERLLPQPAQRSVAVLTLRGRTQVGATFLRVLGDYAKRFQANDGRLYLTGVDEHVRGQLRAAGLDAADGPIHVFQATPIIGESFQAASEDAAAWLAETVDAGQDLSQK